jgi:formylglycine-generating enzyme
MKAKPNRDIIPAGVSFEPANFVLIPGGQFTMGSTEDEVNYQNDEVHYQNDEINHQVQVSTFSISKYAVTVTEFSKFVEASGYQTGAEKKDFSESISNVEVNASNRENSYHKVSGKVRYQSKANHPVVHVNWNDAVAYCEWLSTKNDKQFRLPTEAEREYACQYPIPDIVKNIPIQKANFIVEKKPKRSGTVPVDSFLPNEWGLYNMHGNVFEWCSDWYGGNYYQECNAQGTVINPAGPAIGFCRVIRGCSWRTFAVRCRSNDRYGSTPDFHYNTLGFRLVFDA